MKHFKFVNPAVAVILLLSTHGCRGTKVGPEYAANQDQYPAIVTTILTDRSNYYYLDAASYPDNDLSLPIGVFDSGTGGLTVLEAILRLDAFNNASGNPGSDNMPDFKAESFTYLADQANMPYGVYYAEGKTGLLVEHIIKDVHFLLDDRYYPGEDAAGPVEGKQPVKAVVVACNTATAYGMEYINSFISRTGINMKIFGVIDAGTRGALQYYDRNQDGTIGVMATVGTVGSGGYDASIASLSGEMGYTGHIKVFSIGAHGIAEAVDEERDFIDRSLTAPRPSYRGPSLADSIYIIHRELLDIYNFNFSGNKMLCDNADLSECTNLQLNDPENYVRYHLVSLLEKIRRDPGSRPMKAIILGCTHYPYLTEEFTRVLRDLYNFRRNGEYIYRHLLAEEVMLVDPAVNVATELYAYLRETSLYREDESSGGNHEFYISVPNTSNPSVKLDEYGRFTYDYKYGRTEGEIQEYVKVVPFSRRNISDDTLDRLASFTPLSYRAISGFHSGNSKTSYIKNEFKIVEK